ncbi:MAG: hypothetical protein EZS28_033473 [Streblomastix strix]|uniref:non-specific serine/threonine protein kinase n=1 Tax=Streblomastix strix TaxID=222440 RepID=A0A5J4UKI2_9EUKA|nr:MAG: hypothetical protein EZS28_033473 [Streblomastix strix]
MKVKLADFGFARKLQEGRDFTKFYGGTLQYQAPELHQSQNPSLQIAENKKEQDKEKKQQEEQEQEQGKKQEKESEKESEKEQEKEQEQQLQKEQKQEKKQYQELEKEQEKEQVKEQEKEQQNEQEKEKDKNIKNKQKPKQTIASDIWAFGIIIYELLEHHHPFIQADENIHDLLTFEILRRIVEKEPNKLSPNRSDSLRALLKRMLVKDPSKRISAEEILEWPEIKAIIMKPDEEQKQDKDEDI